MTIRRRFRPGPRLPLGLAAAAAAIATSAALATAGSAQAPPATLHLVGKSQKSVGFFPKGRFHQGLRLGFGDTVSGDDTGIDRAVCTAIGRGLLCTIQVQLSKGTLTAQGMVPEHSHNTPIAITGGTGAYDGARGTALVTDVNKNTTKVDITLLP